MANKAYSLAHKKWMCKYHIVFIPKYRRKVIYNQLRKGISGYLREILLPEDDLHFGQHLQQENISRSFCLMIPKSCQGQRNIRWRGDLLKVSKQSITKVNYEDYTDHPSGYAVQSFFITFNYAVQSFLLHLIVQSAQKELCNIYLKLLIFCLQNRKIDNILNMNKI